MKEGCYDEKKTQNKSNSCSYFCNFKVVFIIIGNYISEPKILKLSNIGKFPWFVCNFRLILLFSTQNFFAFGQVCQARPVKLYTYIKIMFQKNISNIKMAHPSLSNKCCLNKINSS